MISVRYYLHNKANKKGLHPLYMSVHLDGVARLQQAVGESISPKQWNHVNQKVTHKHDYFKEMNTRLDNLKTKVKVKFQEMMDEGELPTGADLRMILRPLRAQKLLNTGKASTVREVYDVWKINYLKKKNRGFDITGKPEKELQGYNYARSYSQVVQALDDFRPGLRPRDLTEKLWEEYLGYLYEELEVSDSTVGTHIKGWKIFQGYLKEDGTLDLEKLPDADDVRLKMMFAELDELEAGEERS